MSISWFVITLYKDEKIAHYFSKMGNSGAPYRFGFSNKNRDSISDQSFKPKKNEVEKNRKFE